MTLSWNPRDDFLDAADSLEAVTLTSTSGTNTPVSGALRMRISEQEVAESNGRYTRRDVRWHLPAVQVAAPPQIGATITDGQGQKWTILEVDHDTRSSRWRCWCRLVRLTTTLSDRVNIQQASWTKDDHGGLVATWSNWKTDLAARVQALQAAVAAEHEQRFVRVTHVVYLAQPLELTQNHRLYHPDTATALHILGYEMPGRLDELFSVRAVKTPWV